MMTGFKLKQIHVARKSNLLHDTTFERKRDEGKKRLVQNRVRMIFSNNKKPAGCSLPLKSYLTIYFHQETENKNA